MDYHQLTTAAYLKEKEDSMPPDPPEVGADAGKPAESDVAGSYAIVFTAGMTLFFGYLFALLACSDLFEIPIYNDEYLPSPLSPLVTSTEGLWIFYVGGVLLFVLGAVGVGSQPWVPALGVIYVMCPIAGAVCIAGWPLRHRTPLRESIAVIYAGLGAALSVGGILGFQSSVETMQDKHILLYSLAIEAGLAMLIGGIFAWSNERALSQSAGQ